EAHRRPQLLHRLGADALVLRARVDDAERGRRAARLRAPDHLRDVPLERLVGEVTVRVDHGRAGRRGRAAHRTLEPGGGGSANETSSGLAPSGPPASTMPFDSIPIILRGARLATITIVRPTIASGSQASARPARIVRGAASPASTVSFSSLVDF